ncbi:hypothetical protein COF76_23270 [Bacillus wiedmannii]|uniref:toll/interleukin-1 receptor domain-containing protein n=1 Tax=Bacillus wiedmannii TaxID=1890302 RepID=UPI000BFBDF5C|nr:toll/interleukin-1 receptor domain-containing protein [Bacillus wiedmannii]PHE94731.1 hypothetical protein COF76_23270 [Bacillus wiedmannii]
MSQNDFFISHATNDSKLVNQFMKFLQLTLGVNRQSIYCTSTNGTKSIGIGDNFIENIKAHVTDTKMVIFIFTPNYFKSNFCLAELGAAWVLNRNIYPIIIPPTDRSILGTTPLGTPTQALTINTAKDIVKIADDFRNKGIADYSDSGYVSECAEELMDWIKTNCKFETDETVSKSDYVAVQSELESLQKTIHQKDTELAFLKDFYEKEIEFKRKEIVRVSEDGRAIEEMEEMMDHVIEEHEETLTKWDLFDEQIKSVKSVLSRLDNVVISAIYYDEFHQGRRFWPDQDDFFNWSNVQRLEAENKIRVDGDDQRITPNYDEYLVGRAVDELHDLLSYLSSNIDEKMEQEFAEDNEFNLEFKSKTFWEKILNVTIYV